MNPVTHNEHMKQFTLPVRRSLLAPTPDWLTSPRRSWRAAGPRRLTPGCHWRWRWSPCRSPWCQHGHADVPAVGGRRLPAAPSSEASCPFYWGEEEGGDVCFSTCFLIKWLITHLILNILLLIFSLTLQWQTGPSTHIVVTCVRFCLLAPAPWWSPAAGEQGLWGSAGTAKPSCHICYWWPPPETTGSPGQVGIGETRV